MSLIRWPQSLRQLCLWLGLAFTSAAASVTPAQAQLAPSAQYQELFAGPTIKGTGLTPLKVDYKYKFTNKILPQPAADLVDGKLQRVKLSDLHFMQNTISNNYADGVHTVVGNAKLIRSGALLPQSFPPVQIWRDVEGHFWTLDHRRVGAMLLAGNVDYLDAVETGRSKVERDAFKFSSVDQGHTMVLPVENQGALFIQKTLSRAVAPRAYVSEGVALQTWGKLALGNVPKLKTKPPQPTSWQSRGSVVGFKPNQILWSDFKIDADESADVITLARQIKTGQITVTSLPPLRIWRDSLNQVWTLDNQLLAAYSLANVQTEVPVQEVVAESPQVAQKTIRTFTNGRSLLLLDTKANAAHLLRTKVPELRAEIPKDN